MIAVEEIERLLRERLVMAREVLDETGHTDAAVLIPVEEVLGWIDGSWVP